VEKDEQRPLRRWACEKRQHEGSLGIGLRISDKDGRGVERGRKKEIPLSPGKAEIKSIGALFGTADLGNLPQQGREGTHDALKEKMFQRDKNRTEGNERGTIGSNENSGGGFGFFVLVVGFFLFWFFVGLLGGVFFVCFRLVVFVFGGGWGVVLGVADIIKVLGWWCVVGNGSINDRSSF